jgi:enoyl-CoA hydratase/carnithine racemase
VTIRLSRVGRCGVVTIDDVTRRNALTTADWRALAQAIQDWGDTDDTDGIVITGSEGTFCAGARLDELDAAAQDAAVAYEFVHAIVDGLRAVRGSAKPVVAAINGPAVGGGAELALACDLRIGTARTRIGFPMLRLGVVLDRITLRTLLYALPLGRAQSVLLGGVALGAEDALRAGMLTELVDQDIVVSRAISTVEMLGRLDVRALQTTRAAINEILFPVAEDASAEMLESVLARIPIAT